LVKKRRLLSKIDVTEVSLVDRPANQTSFLFWKSGEGEQSAFEKQFKSLKVEFETDGSGEGSSLAINGKTITALQGFTLSASPMGDNMGIYCSYTQGAKNATVDGFVPTYTYSLSKSNDVPQMAKAELEKVIREEGGKFVLYSRDGKKKLGVHDTEEGALAQERAIRSRVKKADDADIAVLQGLVEDVDVEIDCDLAKALAAPVAEISQYKDDMPASLMDAIGQLVRLAANTAEADNGLAVEKAEGVETTVSENKEEVKPAETPADKPKEVKPAETPVQTLDVAALVAALAPKVTESVLAALAAKAKADAEAADPEVEVDLEQLAREAEEAAVKAPA